MTDVAARAPLVPGIRLVRLVWRMLGPLAVAANIAIWPMVLGASDDLREQALVVALYLAGYAALSAVVMEVLSPRNRELRLWRMSDHRAERLGAVAKGLIFLLLATQLAIHLVEANDWSPAVTAMLRLLRNAGLILVAWSALGRSGVLRRITPEKTKGYGRMLLWLSIKIVLPLAMLTLLFSTVTYALGYEALARWVLQNAAWTALLFFGLAVAYRFVRRRLRRAITFVRDEEAGETAEPAPGWIGLERILAGTLKILIAIGAVFALQEIWNTSMGDVVAALDRPIVQGGTLEWGTLVGGLAKVGIVWIVYRFVRNLLIFFVFPRTGVELGARYAILTVLQYAAVVFGVLFVFAALGVDTSTLAVFAGGATVGLAFGMKDIFSNFFSGLIMLLERPVRVGDTVDVGGTKGKIEAVRLRGTRIRTFDGTIVIVPNTEMIGSRLANLSHSFETARMQVDVGVSYSEDPQRVQEVLLEVARADPRVVSDPEPVVRFNEFGDSSLDFSLRVWTRDIDERWALVSELRVKIFEAFREKGIEIPFPQRDLHIRSDVRRGGDV